MARLVAICAVLGLVITASASVLSPKKPQPASTLTISGISSGAAIAVQYDVAFSASVRAAGIIAGLPWDCSESDLETALGCMKPTSTIDIAKLDQNMAAMAAANEIDAVANIKNHDVMLFSGLNDTVVSQRGMRALADQYEALGANKVVTYFNYSAEHAWITDFYGNDCGYLGLPYINNCQLDFAGEFLRMAWSHMGLTFNDTRGTFDPANMRTFSQSAFDVNVTAHSLSGVGYYYVPAACQGASAGCHVHLNFHGCQQDAASLGRTYVDNTGLNQWAESNRVIVVYPQTIASPPENPLACWDWWGYTGPDFLQRTGAQLAFAEAVIAHATTHGDLPPVPSV